MPTRSSFHLSVPHDHPVQLPDPVPGAEISHANPAGNIRKYDYLSFKFTTDANVANRYFRVSLKWTTLEIILAGAASPQPASSTATYVFSPINTAFTAANAHMQFIHWIPGITVWEEWSLTTTTENIQVGDQFSEITYVARDWLLPTP